MSDARARWRYRVVVGLVDGLGGGLAGKQVNEHDYRTPNEGIRRSVRNSVVAALGGGLVVVLVGGLGVGLVFGLGVGGMAALRHAALRWVLRRAGLVPPHLVRFLDYAADHILLQRVGGGYRFIHVLLRDYFADLNTDRRTE